VAFRRGAAVARGPRSGCADSVGGVKGTILAIRSAGRAFSRNPFMHGDGPHQIVSGVVDLMFRESGHWKIVDYKTDVGPTNLSASYAQQLNMYERALARVGIEGAVSEIHLVRIEEAAMPSDSRMV
jgi:ATP-dependent exoDNAse (exonuclease V) beta subunit